MGINESNRLLGLFSQQKDKQKSFLILYMAKYQGIQEVDLLKETLLV